MIGSFRKTLPIQKIVSLFFLNNSLQGNASACPVLEDAPAMNARSFSGVILEWTAKVRTIAVIIQCVLLLLKEHFHMSNLSLCPIL